MNNEKRWWNCTCGQKTQGSESEVASGSKLCPACGSPIRLNQAASSASPGLEETQVIKLREMARMAQEGIDVGVSGEWDTSLRVAGGSDDDQ